jgi:hypothetical protein
MGVRYVRLAPHPALTVDSPAIRTSIFLKEFEIEAGRESRTLNAQYNPRAASLGAREREMMKRVWFGLVFAALALSSIPAFAQQPAAGGAKAGGGSGGSGGKEEGYGYEFSDDPLAAGGFGPNDATIRVRPGPVRTTLIRPRTSFVPEMLKSVENL